MEAIKTYKSKLKPAGTVVADTIDNKVAKAFNAWPDRIVVLEADGRVAYQQKPGPMGYRSNEALTWVSNWASKNK